MSVSFAEIVTTCFLCGILVTSLLTATPPVDAAEHPQASTTPPQGDLFQQSFDADAVLIDVRLRPNGTAGWTIQYRIDIGGPNETAAFEELQSDIRRNTSDYLPSFRTRIRATAAAAENATNRSMRTANFSVQTRTEPLSESGFVTYSFTWYGFAATDGRIIRAGDAIAGLFLDDRTTLTISWPETLSVRSVTPPATRSEANAISWAGRQRFDADEPRVVVGPPASGLPAWITWTVAVLGLILLSVIGLLYYRREEQSTKPETADPDSVATTDTETAHEEDIPSDLLKNDEQVIRLLEQRGGRVKQQEVVSALDWTEAKTSQVITDMRESGDVEVFRIGRENVITLPETDLTEIEDSDDEATDEDGSA